VFTEPECLVLAGFLAIPAWLARPTPWTCASTSAGASSTTCAGG